MKHCLIIVTLFLLYAKPHQACGQNASETQQAVIKHIARLKDAYASFKDISVDMQYYYANESTPNKRLDSIKGMLWFNGNSYRMVMDKTEMLVNEKYSICVFEEDKLIYLNKPSISAATYNPVSMIDSLLSPKGGGKASIENSSQGIAIKITMPSGGAWKSLAFIVDTTTNLLKSCTMVVKTTFMSPTSDMASLKEEGYDEYAIVQANYTNYKKETLPAEYFNESSFIIKQGKAFTATKKYEGYQVFLGTINL